jgi:hypothetical protein
MSFFEDLTPYSYFHPEQELPNTVNIGWLDRSKPFPSGTTSEEFQVKLGKLCQRRVKQTRGIHRCDFCKGRNRPMSSSEMRVAGVGNVYAAPSLVHHYVVAHNYRPPDEFIAAVLAWEQSNDVTDSHHAVVQVNHGEK